MPRSQKIPPRTSQPDVAVPDPVPTPAPVPMEPEVRAPAPIPVIQHIVPPPVETPPPVEVSAPAPKEEILVASIAPGEDVADPVGEEPKAAKATKPRGKKAAKAKEESK